jgi:predicted AAA+ superfamily ATPase
MRLYLVVGGLPSVVKVLLETGSLEQVETEKARILMSMVEAIENVEQPALAKKIKQVFDSIPTQLEKENMKFQYGMVKLTARAREYKDAVEWLVDNKFITPLYRVKEPIAPLYNQKDDKSFEMYVNDIGLLVSMFGITMDDIEKETSPFTMRGQALVKQYIYGELLHNPNVNNIYYWISEATAKIEFLFQDSNVVIPIDVNLDLNEKAQSLKVYKSKYTVPMAVRISKEKMSMSKDMLTLPMFSIWNL